MTCLILPLPAFRIQSVLGKMLSRSFDDAIVMQIVTCHSHVGQKSVLQSDLDISILDISVTFPVNFW